MNRNLASTVARALLLIAAAVATIGGCPGCGGRSASSDGAGGSGGSVCSAGAGGSAPCENAKGGPAPACRYTVVDPGMGPNDGSGLVKDAATNLTWDRFSYANSEGGYYKGRSTQAQADSYCQGKGARLPTVDEVVAVAGVNTDSCAWPSAWGTWTSTSAGAGWAWVVEYDGKRGGSSSDGKGDFALCVR